MHRFRRRSKFYSVACSSFADDTKRGVLSTQEYRFTALACMGLCTGIATGDDAVVNFEVEKNYVNGKFKAITIYFGKLAKFL